MSFFLDGQPRGEFQHIPQAIVNGTPTVNSPVDQKFISNFPVFSASDLDNTNHTVVVNVGIDSVFLFDYAVYTTLGSSGSVTASAPSSERTGGLDA